MTHVSLEITTQYPQSSIKSQSKKDSKYQESIQSSTTPVSGYQIGKEQDHSKQHKQEPSPFPSGDHKAAMNRLSLCAESQDPKSNTLQLSHSASVQIASASNQCSDMSHSCTVSLESLLMYAERMNIDDGSAQNLDLYSRWRRQHGSQKEAFVYMRLELKYHGQAH